MTGRIVSRETPAWRWVTDRGLRLASGDETLALYRRLGEAMLPEVAELVPADGSLLVVLKPGAPIPVRLSELFNGAKPDHIFEHGGRLHEIGVNFDGQDLFGVADYLKLTPPSLIEGLCEINFRVRFLGFQPGFAYLEGLPVAWHISRRDSPRLRVPAGSLALGGAYCGIYPAEGPGGWHLLGRTDRVLFDPEADPPALFQPGDRVRLIPE